MFRKILLSATFLVALSSTNVFADSEGCTKNNGGTACFCLSNTSSMGGHCMGDSYTGEAYCSCHYSLN